MPEKFSNVKNIVDKGTLPHTVPLSYIISKRVFDIFLSLIGMLFLIPLFLIVAIAIKIDSRGPVFFNQNRCGYRGKVFKMYKFRSMVSNAQALQENLERKNDIQGHMFKMKEDPRVTRVGRFIRKTSIDEFPQLFNVLKGQMSIVGPRPPLVSEVSKYHAWHNLRMSAKPGITGLWQISKRNSVSFEEMVRLDMKYIRERNFFYDVKIMLRTLPLLFGDKRAY